MAIGLSRRNVVIVVLLVAAGAILVPLLVRPFQARECKNRMRLICCAARVWACQHRGCLPVEMQELSSELASPDVLICPGDPERTAAATWGAFKPENCSYEMVTPSARDGDTKAVFVRCRIHRQHFGYADSFVFEGERPAE